jgi:peptidoglycan/xylan/chitin deacetylase (PgdA/CDA1 family)
MYHRVGACGADPHRLSVSEATFRGQIAWLRDSCRVVPLGELAGNHDTTSERPIVALTFDDGYRDNLTVAAPVLREFELPATFFLTTEEGRSPYHYWWDRLAHALLEVEDVAQTLTIDLPSGRRTFDTSTAAQRLQTHMMVYHAIVRLAPGKRDAIVRDVSIWAGTPTLEPADRRMRWSEVSQLMTDSRFTIGAHTVQHSYLPAQSEELMTAELRGSRTTLQALTGSSVDTLAYPFGAYDERTVASARAAGFRLAVTCDERAVGPADDALKLPRVEVIEESSDRFVSRIERHSHVVT